MPNIIKIIDKTRIDVYIKNEEMMIKATRMYLVNNNHATAYNFGYTSSSGSNGNGGIKFDGVDDYLEVTTHVVFKTVSLWINLWPVTDARYFIGGSSTNGIRYNGATFLVFYSSGYTEVAWTKLNKIVNVMFVRQEVDISLYDIYVDGIKIGTSKSATDGADLLVRFIGKRGDGQYQFTGTIYNVAVYNRYLSAAEVLQNYNANSRYYN